MIVTTCLRPTNQLIQDATQVAKDLSGIFVERNELSLSELFTTWYEPIIVIGKERIEWYQHDKALPYFFHPNSSVFRIKRLMRGEHDPFCEATQLTEGQVLLDCTLGMASDSLVGSYIVGENGKVVGLEKSEIISYITNDGLKTDKQNIKSWTDITNRIQVKNVDYKDYLSEQEDDSFDVVYFDPMFEKQIIGSNGIEGLKILAEYDDITYEAIHDAIRVARKRVVLKDHFRSERFKKFGFHQIVRKTSEFHFGYIEKEDAPSLSKIHF